MKINREVFFTYVRAAPFGGRLTSSQVEGLTAILDYWALATMTDIRWLAYVLATAFHETGATMQPVRETLAKSDAQAVARLEAAWKAGKLKSVKTPYWRPDANGLSWFGRGLVQLTHLANYLKMARILGIPLDKNPTLALDLKTSVAIIFEGMTRGISNKGDFTNKALEDYFNATIDDPVGARRIVNGKDKADLIASYYLQFFGAIKKASEVATGEKPMPVDVTPETAKPDDVPAAKSKSLWTILLAVFGGGGVGTAKTVMDSGSSFFGAISNPWALLAFVAVLVGGGVLIWLITTGRITINRTKALT